MADSKREFVDEPPPPWWALYRRYRYWRYGPAQIPRYDPIWREQARGTARLHIRWPARYQRKEP